MTTSLLDQARSLSVDEQLELVEALWDHIEKQSGVPPATAAQAAELDRRLAEHEARPDDALSWGEVKDAAVASLKR